jgi:alpha-L-arabinofuranosidase
VEGKGAGLHGQSALNISYRSGTGLVGLGNRGFRNEGIPLLAGKEYDGYLFVKSTTAVTVNVSLRSYVPNSTANRVLASVALPFGGGNWTKLNFSLIPSDDAPCEGVTSPDPDLECCSREPGNSTCHGSTSGHVCVRCGGEFAVGLSAPGDALIDFVFLQPGEWGRYKGLPVHRETVKTLQRMGVTSIRFGGSFVSYFGGYYFWKYWRGVPWARPSVGARWQGDVISSWGPFEQIDMCNAAGIEPIITTTSQDQVPRHTGPYDCCDPEDMADLVEYCYGNSSTEYGQLRISDGHPEPYRVRYFELGNEQYNTFFPDQVRAMEARAKQVGVGGELYYISPANGDWFKLNATEGDAAEALQMGDHLLEDFHVGGGVSTGANWSETTHMGGAVDGSRQLFANNTAWHEGSCNLETNAGIHTMERALQEGADLNDFFSSFILSTTGEASGRIKARTASFCTERSGYNEGGANDQGLAFYLPNGTWLQPPGYVHKMIHDTWLPLALAVAVDGSDTLSISAQIAEDRSRLRLLATNNQSTAVTAAITISGWVATSGGGETTVHTNITTLSADSLGVDNPPSNPERISPKSSTSSTPKWSTDGASAYSFPPLSVSAIVLTLKTESTYR